MKIEARMNEFEKVSNKKPVEDVSKRMKDFEQVERKAALEGQHKEGALPFGLKRYKACPHCGEIMEIYKIEEGKAVYQCKACEKVIDQPIMRA